MKKVVSVILALSVVCCIALLTGCGANNGNDMTTTDMAGVSDSMDMASSVADDIMNGVDDIDESMTGNVELTTDEDESKKESEVQADLTSTTDKATADTTAQ